MADLKTLGGCMLKAKMGGKKSPSPTRTATPPT